MQPMRRAFDNLELLGRRLSHGNPQMSGNLTLGHWTVLLILFVATTMRYCSGLAWIAARGTRLETEQHGCSQNGFHVESRRIDSHH
ncbi:MAG: hypothetical protein ACXW4Z_19640, partial [Candidatus Binatia bacterium]